MGEQKLALTLGDRTLLGTVLHHLSQASLDEVICVLRPGADELAKIAQQAGVKVTRNLLPGRGKTSSIKAGLRALHPETETVIIVPGDMPFLLPETFERVGRAACEAQSGVAVACYRGRRGHPVAFHQSRFCDILALSDDDPLYTLTRGKVTHLDLDDPGILININTPQQYEEACGRIGLPFTCKQERS